jgi:hypothetical protein
MLKVIPISMNSVHLKDIDEAFLAAKFRKVQQPHWIRPSEELIEIFKEVNPESVPDDSFLQVAKAVYIIPQTSDPVEVYDLRPEARIRGPFYTLRTEEEIRNAERVYRPRVRTRDPLIFLYQTEEESYNILKRVVAYLLARPILLGILKQDPSQTLTHPDFVRACEDYARLNGIDLGAAKVRLYVTARQAVASVILEEVEQYVELATIVVRT